MWAAGWNFDHVTLIHVQKASKTSAKSSAPTLMVNMSTSTASPLMWGGCPSTAGVSNVTASVGNRFAEQKHGASLFCIRNGILLSAVAIKDRCKLYCRVAGTTSFYQLKDRVADGTPCGTETNDICVQGLCRVSKLRVSIGEQGASSTSVTNIVSVPSELFLWTPLK